MRSIAAIAIALSLVGGGCTPKPVNVVLTEQWPDRPGEWEKVRRAWTRHGRIMSGWDLVLNLHATFKSPEWRTAYVAQRTKLQHLRPKDRQALIERHKAEEKQFYELELLISTYDRSENDLARGKRSMWSIWLIDGFGKQVEPISIKKDKRPRGVIREYFPNFDDFDEAYVVRFPRTIDVLHPGAKQFSLRMASAHGAVEVVWKEKQATR